MGNDKWRELIDQVASLTNEPNVLCIRTTKSEDLFSAVQVLQVNMMLRTGPAQSSQDRKGSSVTIQMLYQAVPGGLTMINPNGNPSAKWEKVNRMAFFHRCPWLHDQDSEEAESHLPGLYFYLSADLGGAVPVFRPSAPKIDHSTMISIIPVKLLSKSGVGG